MSPDGPEDEPASERREPVGHPVVRGDATVTGDRAREAVHFEPDDPESLARAAETVRAFASGSLDGGDHIYMLRGAAACAALVLGEGSYKAAAARAGEPVTVSFIRKWARVHDLPQAVRRHVARGDLAPTAAKHIARISGDARFLLAWAALDHDLTVREIRSIASEVNDGRSVEEALADRDIPLGELTIRLRPATYRDLRRAAAYEGVEPDEIVDGAISAFLAEDPGDQSREAPLGRERRGEEPGVPDR